MADKEQSVGEKLRQWWPMLLVVAAGISSSSVEGYQIIDLRDRMDKQEAAQVQQIRLEEQTEAIKDDVGDLEEDGEEVNDKIDEQGEKAGHAKISVRSHPAKTTIK